MSSVIPPLSPDYAGAASVFYPLGGTVLINGASGCLSNYAGYDEPRLLDKRSLILSSGLRDVRAIFGDEDFLTENLPLLESLEWSRYLLLLSSPAACIIGTDHAAVARAVEKDLAVRNKSIPVFSFETTGIDSYDKGEESATKALLDYALEHRETSGGVCDNVEPEILATCEDDSPNPRVLFVGCSPLSIWGKDNLQYLEKLPESWGVESLFMLGKDTDINALTQLGRVDYVVACSAGSLKPARTFAKSIGAELAVGLPHTSFYAQDIRAWAERSQQKLKLSGGEVPDRNTLATKDQGAADISTIPSTDAVSAKALPTDTLAANAPSSPFKSPAPRILILTDQVYAHSLRLGLLDQDPALAITCASHFAMDKKLKAAQDVALHSEDEVKELISQGFDLIIADPLIQALCPSDQAFIPVPHIAVSSRLFMHAIPQVYGQAFIERCLAAVKPAQTPTKEVRS